MQSKNIRELLKPLRKQWLILTLSFLGRDGVLQPVDGDHLPADHAEVEGRLVDERVGNPDLGVGLMHQVLDRLVGTLAAEVHVGTLDVGKCGAATGALPCRRR